MFKRFNNIYLFNRNNLFSFHKKYFTSVSNQDFQIKETEIRRIISLLTNSKSFLENKVKLKAIEKEVEIITKNINSIDNEKQSKIFKEFQRIKKDIEQIEELQSNFNYYTEISEEAKKKNDDSMNNEISIFVCDLYRQSTDLEFKSLMSQENDHENCFLEIHAGAGGLDSMDWSEILSSMYRKWAHRKDFNVTTVDLSEGEVGFKRVTLKIEGEFAYGWCRTENGIHRLIRLSPFDSSGKRHTSFASVLVYPVADEDDNNIELQPKDLNIETMRSSGPGGQHSNKTESAVRITHIPTGTSVSVSDQRSQHQNKSIAMNLLKSKLKAIELKKKLQQEEEFRSDLGVNGWASDKVVRTYTMHPQTRVKDPRTNLESPDINNVIDGGDELDIFIKTALSIKY